MNRHRNLLLLGLTLALTVGVICSSGSPLLTENVGDVPLGAVTPDGEETPVDDGETPLPYAADSRVIGPAY